MMSRDPIELGWQSFLVVFRFNCTFLSMFFLYFTYTVNYNKWAGQIPPH